MRCTDGSGILWNGVRKEGWEDWEVELVRILDTPKVVSRDPGSRFCSGFITKLPQGPKGSDFEVTRICDIKNSRLHCYLLMPCYTGVCCPFGRWIPLNTWSSAPVLISTWGGIEDFLEGSHVYFDPTTEQNIRNNIYIYT